MFDLRYHALSLAAVFAALLIGVLLGVGIAESGGVERAENAALRGRVEELERELEAVQDAERARTAAQVVVR